MLREMGQFVRLSPHFVEKTTIVKGIGFTSNRKKKKKFTTKIKFFPLRVDHIDPRDVNCFSGSLVFLSSVNPVSQQVSRSYLT